MRVCIFGLGYVGTVAAGCLARLGHHVVGVDVDKTKVCFLNKGKSPVVEPLIQDIIAEQRGAGRVSATTSATEAILHSEISFICVGTPSTQRGHLNLEAVYSVAQQIAQALAQTTGFHVLALRSTVLPGTNDAVTAILEKASGKAGGKDFAVVSNPEFLREGTAVKDFYDPPFTLLASTSPEAIDRMRELYRDISAPIVETDVRVAEMIKYVNNSFHALKITFANEVGYICRKVGVDSRELMRVFCADKKLNLSPYYLRPGFAYGGSCLPKDLKALATIAHDNYLRCPIIENISASNEFQKEALLSEIISFGKQRIGFLGLSFKSETDDLRNSPIVDVIEKLLGKGFDLRICDPSVHLSRLKGANKKFIAERIPFISRFITGSAGDVVDHAEVVVIVNGDRSFVGPLSRACDDKIIYDLADLDFEGRAGRRNYVGVAW